MKTTTTIKSWPAITLGGLFAIGTAYVMFSDVRSLADFTFDHSTTALILIGTVAAGHMIWPRLKSWRTWLQAVGLAVLFVAGTWYCVTASAGRNAEATAAKVAGVDVANAERARLARALVDADEAHKKARDAETKECATGAGKKCLAARETTAKRKADAADAELAFRKAPHEKIANGGTKHAAQVFALMLPASPVAIEHAIGLLTPFAKALFLEIATLIFLGIGLGHRQVPAVSSVSTVSEPKGLSFERPYTDEEIEELTRVLNGMGQPLTNDEVAAALRISKSEASKRVQKAVDAGKVVKLKTGRFNAISLVA
jgi:hypothetical protein